MAVKIPNSQSSGQVTFTYGRCAFSRLAVFAAALSVRAAIGLCVESSVAPPVTSTAEAEWHAYNGDYTGQRFSPLDQIDATNVDTLSERCRVQVAGEGSFQTGPVVQGGWIFVTTPHETFAIDATDCKLQWKASHPSMGADVYLSNRGVGVAEGLVVRGTPDGRVLAMNRQSGNLLWSNQSADSSRGEFFSAAPLIWEGVVYIGVAGGDWGIRGRMLAFDAATGRRIWTFHTIPVNDEPGADSWHVRDTARRGGGGTWSSYSLDVSAAELFVPVGNPAPDYVAEARPGDNLFTNSIVVLDAHSGTLKWWYQINPADGKDLDLGSAPMLYRAKDQRELVAAAGKNGYLYVLDRTTHQLVFKVPTTTIKGLDQNPTEKGASICPGGLGGTGWNGPAFDRLNHAVVVSSLDWCSIYRKGEVRYIAGQVYMAGAPEFVGKGAAWLNSFDADSGALRWRYHSETLMVAGVTPTAGGLVLTGDLTGNLLVLNSKDGKVLRSIPVGGAIAGGVVTYAVAGKQYVAVASGSTSRMSIGGSGVPTMVIFSTQSERKASNDLGPTPGVVSEGKRVFFQNCAICHGAGGASLPDHDLRGIKARLSQAELASKIRNPKPPMPRLFPLLLSQDDLRNVIAFLNTL